MDSPLLGLDGTVSIKLRNNYSVLDILRCAIRQLPISENRRRLRYRKFGEGAYILREKELGTNINCRQKSVDLRPTNIGNSLPTELYDSSIHISFSIYFVPFFAFALTVVTWLSPSEWNRSKLKIPQCTYATLQQSTPITNMEVQWQYHYFRCEWLLFGMFLSFITPFLLIIKLYHRTLQIKILPYVLL